MFRDEKVSLLDTECKQSDVLFALSIKQRNFVSKSAVNIGAKFIPTGQNLYVRTQP